MIPEDPNATGRPLDYHRPQDKAAKARLIAARKKNGLEIKLGETRYAAFYRDGKRYTNKITVEDVGYWAGSLIINSLYWDYSLFKTKEEAEHEHAIHNPNK